MNGPHGGSFSDVQVSGCLEAVFSAEGILPFSGRMVSR